MEDQIEKTRMFWQRVPFFGSPVEDFLARYWYAVFLVPFAIIVSFGFWIDRYESHPHSLQSVTIILRDPYMSTLAAALICSAIAFHIWQLQTRQTFSTAIEAGLVWNTPDDIQGFLSMSLQFPRLMRSRWRFSLIAMFVAATLVGNRTQLADIFLSSSTWPRALVFSRLAIMASFVGLSYAIGAVAWSLVGAARWIAYLSSNSILRIQPGHSDGCCGLEGVGSCCLQSAVPLLIGMVLCLVWSNGQHLAGFQHYWNTNFLSAIAAVSYVLMAVLFVLACALVFLPVRGLHLRLGAYKREREAEFIRALEAELSNIRNVLVASDEIKVKLVSDRLKLVQALDPAVLKLSTWPFDKTSLIKYGITPLFSLGASLLKEVFIKL